MFPPPNRNNAPGEKPDGSNNGQKPPQFQIPRWTWMVFLGILLLWSFLRLPDMMSSVSPSQPITVPYSFFYEQVVNDNVSQVVLQDAEAQGTFRSAVTWPPDGSPLVLTADNLQLIDGASEQGEFSLTIDGVERAMTFAADFARRGDATAPLEDV